MLARVCLILLVFAPVLARCQDGGNNVDDPAPPPDETLLLPAPISLEPYPTQYAGKVDDNYVNFGVTFSTQAWNSSATTGNAPQFDSSYSLWPSLALHRNTSRAHLTLGYSPGLTIYQHSSSRNEFDHRLQLNAQYALTPHLNLSLLETFSKLSNVFNQPNPTNIVTVNGSLPPPPQALIAPQIGQLANSTGAQVAYQVGESTMIGATGNYSLLSYSNVEQIPGFYNSSYASGGAFYSHRLGTRYYVGANYQFQDIFNYQDLGNNTRAQINTVYGFLSVYLTPRFSVSFSAGPQHYNAIQYPATTQQNWGPLLLASLGWQGEHSSAAFSWRRSVGSGAGLNGVFDSNTLTAYATRQLTAAWNGQVSVSYLNYNSLTPFFLFSSPSGHTFLGGASLRRRLTDRAGLEFGYNWIRQQYQQVSSSAAPNYDGVFISISYSINHSPQE